MNTPRKKPAGPRPARFRKSLDLAYGIGAGLVLWLIIGLSTGNAWIGVLFGLAPGVAIGLGLLLTARS
ncbi:hypothetical protein [Maricaulis sp.]|uniref:hypothetical protein n=1 Tax=Maricaulis sp. TaxID=1486257 RepID=UPI003A94BF2E